MIDRRRRQIFFICGIVLLSGNYIHKCPWDLYFICIFRQIYFKLILIYWVMKYTSKFWNRKQNGRYKLIGNFNCFV